MADELRAHLDQTCLAGLTDVIARIYNKDMTVLVDVPLTETIDGTYVGDVPAIVDCGEYPVHIYDNQNPSNPIFMTGGTLIWDGFSESSRPDISGSSQING